MSIDVLGISQQLRHDTQNRNCKLERIMHDAIIVLGYSTEIEHPIFRARVEKAASLYQQAMAGQIIMSGCCSVKLENQPKTTEAAAMMHYAVELGVPAPVILLEEESVDTLGNFYYCKTQLLEPCSWYHVGIVSTPWHVWRSEYLANKVLGPDYDITLYASEQPAGWTPADEEKSESYNREMLALHQLQLGEIQDGDHEAVAALLGKKPPP